MDISELEFAPPDSNDHAYKQSESVTSHKNETEQVFQKLIDKQSDALEQRSGRQLQEFRVEFGNALSDLVESKQNELSKLEKIQQESKEADQLRKDALRKKADVDAEIIILEHKLSQLKGQKKALGEHIATLEAKRSLPALHLVASPREELDSLSQAPLVWKSVVEKLEKLDNDADSNLMTREMLLKSVKTVIKDLNQILDDCLARDWKLLAVVIGAEARSLEQILTILFLEQE